MILLQQAKKRKVFEPLDARVYVSFAEYDELSIKNIKSACEKHFNKPSGTCDVLVDNEGPSAQRYDQIKKKDNILIRFLSNGKSSSDSAASQKVQAPTPKVKHEVAQSEDNCIPHSEFAKSICITDLMKAGKLQKLEKPSKLELQEFDLDICC